jgi:hypothetical protein
MKDENDFEVGEAMTSSGLYLIDSISVCWDSIDKYLGKVRKVAEM